MIITLTRSGGFTGIPLKKTIDTSKLPKDEGKQIEQLIAQGLKASEGETSQSSITPDQFIYTLSMDDGVHSQSIMLPESKLTPQMRKILQKIEEI